MSLSLKNRLLYWFLVMIPSVPAYFAMQFLGSFWFCAILLAYIFTYRPMLDINRLLALGVIDERDAWRYFMPLHPYRYMYWRHLWFG